MPEAILQQVTAGLLSGYLASTHFVMQDYISFNPRYCWQITTTFACKCDRVDNTHPDMLA